MRTANQNKATAWWFEMNPGFELTLSRPGYLYWINEKGETKHRTLESLVNLWKRENSKKSISE